MVYKTLWNTNKNIKFFRFCVHFPCNANKHEHTFINIFKTVMRGTNVWSSNKDIHCGYYCRGNYSVL